MSTFGVNNEDKLELTKQESRHLQLRSLKLLGLLVADYKGRLAATAGLVLVSTVLQVAGPALIAGGIDQGLPALVEQGNVLPIVLISGTFLLTGFFGAFLLSVYTRWSVEISQAVMADLRKRLFIHSQRLSLSFHEHYTSGRTIARQTSDIAILGELLNGGISNLVSGVLFMTFTLGALLTLDPASALPLVGAVIPIAAISVWFQRASRREFRNSRTHSARLIIQFVETMTGIRAVKVFRREKVNIASYADKVEDYREATRRTIQVFGVYEPTLKTIGNLTVALVLLLGAFRVVEGGVEIGVLLAAVLYTRNFFTPIDSVATFYNSFQSASAALEKISGVLEEQPQVAEPAHPVEINQPRGELELKEVNFRYEEDTPVLDTLSLHIPPGQIVALVGATGAGKSSLAKLIARFYDPTSGVVTLDGQDLRDISDQDLRRAIVLVTQEPYLFSGKVADNIRIGRPEASDEEVREAAQAVGADRFIQLLPEGYDTEVNKRGGRLSAGQRQLVSFARAFLANPAVLVLDEATAALDMPSERLVQKGLIDLLSGRTAVIIAHRLSTVQIAHRALVMDHGVVVEDGPTDQLIQGTGRFARLHQAWRESLH